MKLLLTFRKIIWLSAMAMLFLASCEKNEVQETDDRDENRLFSEIPKSKEVYGMLVVDSSIIFNAESLALLDSVTESELIFRERPAQADSMANGFILVTSAVNDLMPSGLLVRSLGTSTGADGFHVKVETAALTDYVLLAQLKGSVSFQEDQKVAPEAYILQGDRQVDADSAVTTNMPSVKQLAKVSRSNLKMIAGTITGSAVDLSFPYTLIGGSQAVLNVAVQPSINYDIVINAWTGTFRVAFGGDLALNNLGLSLTARVPLEINLNGDEVFVPIPIPVGPILITPYFSVTPYLQAGVAGEGNVTFTSEGNIGFDFTQDGFSIGGSAGVDYQVNTPTFGLYADGMLATGIQATVGIGLYGKTVYAQVQAKAGPQLKMRNDILKKQTIVTAGVPVTVDASAGASLLFFNIANAGYRLYEGNVVNKTWTYNWPI